MTETCHRQIKAKVPMEEKLPRSFLPLRRKERKMALLDSSLQVGPLNLQTRIVMPPMATHKAGEDGFETKAMASYYGERAQAGGFGLIETEHHYVSADGRANLRQASASRESDVQALSLTAHAVHAGHTPAVLQISHAGALASPSVTAATPLAPSAIAVPGREGELPRAMSKDDIVRVTRDFAVAARRAVEAGFDGVEVHAAHGYLLDEFYSPLTNHRGDAYGGTAENRARFLVEAAEAVREAVGPNALLSVRLGACDYLEGGATVSDAVVAARLLEGVGVDLISVSGGMCGFQRPGHKEPGWFADASAAIREAASIPVLLTGGIKTAEDAEALLEAGACDLVGVGRPAMRSAAWAANALAK